MYYRKIRTYQERRFNERDIEYVRGRRKPHVIRDAWDDIPNNWYGKMSWKSRTRKSKSWLRGRLKHRWWFLREQLSEESNIIDWYHRGISRFYLKQRDRWSIYLEISKKDMV